MINSLKATWKGRSYHYNMIYLGTKGDWPFLRSSFRLATGFNCLRVCHLCDTSESKLNGSIYFFVIVWPSLKA